jgi:hypothetical protein
METKHSFLPLQGQNDWKDQVSRRGQSQDSSFSRGSLNYLYAIICTSIGKPLFVKPDKSVLHVIWGAHQEFLSREST